MYISCSYETRCRLLEYLEERHQIKVYWTNWGFRDESLDPQEIVRVTSYNLEKMAEAIADAIDNEGVLQVTRSTTLYWERIK